MPSGVYKRTKKTIEKNRISHLGQTSWSKGKTGIYSEEVLEKMRIAHLKENLSKETIEKNRIAHLRENLSDERLKKMSESHLGKYPNGKTRRKMSFSRLGEKHPNWKGGITLLRHRIRNNSKYEEWRLMVFGRDNFTCQDCGQRGVYLEAHHIKSFSSIIQKYEITTIEEALRCEELWNINNGRTLCKDCHKKLRKKNIRTIGGLNEKI